jgi:hypothetical protein
MCARVMHMIECNVLKLKRMRRARHQHLVDRVPLLSRRPAVRAATAAGGALNQCKGGDGEG